ncbi:unknown [Haloarcula marismortui ATCC 43049]|uniref:CARDB domain-containing protein n=1 Tax=Haloarcula marismortui (strain ATCC 43049 / DSM 3752 / JCM 8966 / VKM B-1809) TaxID=272569 RepID=Q5UZK0_HALMA|nr:hypothetical protein [Haloarcula marismortui]AAV47303.1 unknown [Haloarcula marismortui ATCC 43049]QCP92008.1 hypothetical protein E6P14_14515 [Haloarcula marismortui ATCC 43049]
MIRTRTLVVFAALLVVGGLTAQVGAVPGVTAQQESPLEQSGNTGVAVDSLTAPQSVAPNSTADVAATVTNNENASVTESVAFRFDGAVVDRTLVTLAPNESTTVQFSADTTDIEPGDYRHGVFTSDDGQVAPVTVSDSFTLETLDAPTNATAGDNVTADATVANPNDFNTTQTVEFRLGGQPLASESVTLDANESTDVTFTVDTTDIEPDTYTHSVFTRDDGAFAEITIESAIDAPEEPTENETEEPPADETEEPPANETEEPPANETEEPPANETEEPPANETEEPPVNETDEPPADETEEPPANETEEPPADETEEPPADETEEPPANETEEPPANEIEEPPVNETDEPPADETEEPPADETDEPPADETDEPPADETEEPTENETDETDNATEENATTEG